MAPSGLNRILVASLAVVSAIGAVDAAIGGHGDLFAVLGISVGTVKSRISRGRAALATQLRIDRPENPGNQSTPSERPNHLT